MAVPAEIEESWTLVPDGEVRRKSGDSFEVYSWPNLHFYHSGREQTLTADDLKRFGPYTYRAYCAGGYRNKEIFDGAVYSSVAQIAEKRFPSDEFRQRFLIACYFRDRGVDWSYLS